MEIKNTVELLQLLKACVKAYKSAAADGIVDWRDALKPEVRALIPAAQAAISDGGLIAAELKEIDGAEAQKLYEELASVAVELLEFLLK
jgi:hypothetical protein